jgi:hypothetical protein
MTPLRFGGIPQLESTVSAYGYPLGGERMSVTAGIVSRVDFQLYTHSGVDSHLTVQISAQINPGNSGGPVMRMARWWGWLFGIQRRRRSRSQLHDSDARGPEIS